MINIINSLIKYAPYIGAIIAVALFKRIVEYSFGGQPKAKAETSNNLNLDTTLSKREVQASSNFSAQESTQEIITGKELLKTLNDYMTGLNSKTACIFELVKQCKKLQIKLQDNEYIFNSLEKEQLNELVNQAYRDYNQCNCGEAQLLGFLLHLLVPEFLLILNEKIKA